MKLLVFIAKGFETIEFSAFIDVMGWAKTDFNCKVDVVTCGLHRKVISSFGIPVLTDKVIEEVSVDEYDALAIPGGFEEFGFYEEAYSEKLREKSRSFLFTQSNRYSQYLQAITWLESKLKGCPKNRTAPYI